MLVEVCANSIESALVAERAGADRIELCSELAVGGLTPSYGLLKAVKEKVNIPVHVLIRPRSGDFTYSDAEFDIMLADITICKELGFEGIVSGVLTKNFTLDVERTRKLKSTTGHLKFTFHRAFDWVKDPMSTLKTLDDLQIDYILSSGHQKSAPLGIDLLSDLKSQNYRVQIMPGSGINSSNVELFKLKGFNVVHLSGMAMNETLSEVPLISMNSSTFLSDHKVAVTLLENIKAVVTKVK